MVKVVREIGTIDRGLNKESIEGLAASHVREIVKSGEYDLLQVYIELKRYETYLNALIRELKTPAMTQATELGLQRFDYDQARIRLEKRIKYDFSIDTTWSQIERQIQELTKTRKAREKTLRDNQMVQMVDKETGELIAEIDLPREIKHILYVHL